MLECATVSLMLMTVDGVEAFVIENDTWVLVFLSDTSNSDQSTT